MTDKIIDGKKFAENLRRWRIDMLALDGVSLLHVPSASVAAARSLSVACSVRWWRKSMFILFTFTGTSGVSFRNCPRIASYTVKI